MKHYCETEIADSWDETGRGCPNQSTLICRDCDLPVCDECAELDHAGHELVRLHYGGTISELQDLVERVQG